MLEATGWWLFAVGLFGVVSWVGPRRTRFFVEWFLCALRVQVENAQWEL